MSGVALAPPPGAAVLDACSAPGNKTLHLAALAGESGHVTAVERDKKRYGRLRSNVKKHGGNNVTALLRDFLQLVPAEYPQITHILVDPSCSGSGMLTENLVTDFKGVDQAKVEQLATLQTTLLTHALSFPGAQRVVYSTCSVYARENEQVVAEVLAQQADTWQLAKVLPDWARRGDTTVLPEADKCVRCLPEDGTNGFFLACFVRREQEPPVEPADEDFLGGRDIQNIFSVKHINMRFRLKYPYKYPRKFVKRFSVCTG